MSAETSKAVAMRPEKPRGSGQSTGKLSCVFCSETFDDKLLLQEHFRQHGEQKKPIKLTVAVEKVDGKILIKCDYCETVLESVSLAIQHQFKKHKNLSSKYFCAWCGKQFPISYTYSEHMPLHEQDELTNVKGSFECSKCNFTFYNGKSLKYHNNSVHSVHKLYQKNTLLPPPSKKIYVDHIGDMQSIYYCQFCGKEYILKFNLQSHIEKVHNKEIMESPPSDIIRCKLCDAYFYSEKAYDCHSSYHTPTDIYVSSEDMRANVVTKVDQEFDARRVRPCSQQQKLARSSHRKQIPNPALVDVSDFSPPPSDSSDSETEFPDIKPEQEEPVLSKDVITLDQFIEMHSEIFTKNDSDINSAKPSTTTSNVQVKPLNVKSSLAIKDDKCATAQSSELKFAPQNVKKLEVQYMTKEEMDKMKSKGLLRLAPRPKDIRYIKKLHIVAKSPPSMEGNCGILPKNVAAKREEDAYIENIGVNKGGGVIKTFFNRKRKASNISKS